MMPERTFNVAPGTVYNHAGENPVFGPVHMPSTAGTTTYPPGNGAYPPGNSEVERVAPQRIYNPATVYTPHFNPAATPVSPATPTYVHVTPAASYPPAATRVVPPAAPYGGYNGGGHSGGVSPAAGAGAGAGSGNGRSH
jgi:hypothetical protein